MVKTFRLTAVIAFIAALALVVGACGSSNKKASTSTGASTSASTSTTGSGASGKTVTVVYGTAPDFLDPGEGYTTQAAEADWITYTPLYTYAHKTGAPGSVVIPGLATALPTISADGKTYSMTLRKGLTYSDGTPVKASDFGASIQRSMKLNWGGKSFYTSNIAGAEDFDKGKATSISGITADDSTGKITIKLVAPYGAFLNVLAFPSSALLPASTKVVNLSNNPPAGVGPYILKNVVPNQSFKAVPNPKWASFNIPGIPAAKDTIQVNIAANTQSEAESVLNNTADVFDTYDSIPPALVPQIESQAANRFKKLPTVSVYYFFLNTKAPPFNNQLAREAVNYAIDRTALSKLNSGNFTPACFFLPLGMPGHPTGPCPYGADPAGKPDVAKAKALIKQAGLVGAKVTVWGQNREPRKEFIDYYTGVLNQIGFKATTKIIADSTYFPTIGDLKSNPQTGFADWNQDFPNPSDFYLLMDAKSIQPTNNQNFSQVDDPTVQKALAKLNPVPASKLSTVAPAWAKLDTYLAKKAYIAAFGYQQVAKFMSDKMNFNSTEVSPVYGNDWTTFAKN